MVQRAWGSEWSAPDPGAYNFSNGRKYDSTDRGLTGIYGVLGNTLLLLDGSQYPDMRDGIIIGVGLPPGSAENGFGSFQEINPDPRIP